MHDLAFRARAGRNHDVTVNGDGRQHGESKLVAALTEVGTDFLLQSDADFVARRKSQLSGGRVDLDGRLDEQRYIHGRGLVLCDCRARNEQGESRAADPP